MQPGDNILKYFSELTDDQQRQAIEKGIAENTSAMDDLAMLKAIWSESESIGDLQAFDTTEAWNAVEQKIDPDVEARRFTLWPYISVAASIALLVMSGLYFLNRDTAEFVEVITGDDQYMEIILADGSEVELRPNSYLRYPKQFNDTTERRIFLRGDALMTVVTDTLWPFITDNYGAGVRAIGTAYTIESDSSATSQQSILENVSGAMGIFSKSDPTIKAELYNQGDRAIFDGDSIDVILANPPQPPPQDTLSRNIPVINLISVLQEKFQRRFIAGSGIPHSPGAIIKVNLDQDLFSIFAQLDTIADVDYRLDGNTVTLLKLLPKKDE